jgi:hypothetical protein
MLQAVGTSAGSRVGILFASWLASLFNKRALALGDINASSVHSHLRAPLEARLAFVTMRCNAINSWTTASVARTWIEMTEESRCTMVAHSHCRPSSPLTCFLATSAPR